VHIARALLDLMSSLMYISEINGSPCFRCAWNAMMPVLFPWLAHGRGMAQPEQGKLRLRVSQKKLPVQGAEGIASSSGAAANQPAPTTQRQVRRRNRRPPVPSLDVLPVTPAPAPGILTSPPISTHGVLKPNSAPTIGIMASTLAPNSDVTATTLSPTPLVGVIWNS